MQSITTRPLNRQTEMEKDEDFEVDWVLLYDFEDLGKLWSRFFVECALLNVW